MEAGLDALIRRLNHTDPLTQANHDALYQKHADERLDRLLGMGDAVETPAGLAAFLHSEKRGLTILNQPEDAFRAELKSIDNELERQIEIVNEGLDIWFDIGQSVPPYYAWRIAVILAKAKRPDDEKAFLAAWCRHFGNMIGARYEALADRARKRGLTF